MRSGTSLGENSMRYQNQKIQFWKFFDIVRDEIAKKFDFKQKFCRISPLSFHLLGTILKRVDFNLNREDIF